MEDILEDEDITRKEVENHQAIMTKGIQEEEGPLMMEDPLTMEDLLIMEDPLMMEDPQMMEDPLMMEDPQEMEGCQEDLEDEDHQVHQDLLGQCIQ